MRTIRTIPHEKCNITIFHWNNRYLVKLENGLFEQTYKIPQYDLAGEGDLDAIISEEFIDESVARFEQMAESLRKAMARL